MASPRLSEDGVEAARAQRARPYRYTAFISYSHSEDSEFAPALQRSLQGFSKPWYRPRAMRVFRDTTNLSARPNLWETIQDALAESEFFVFLASPLAARSKWVRKELEYWLANRSSSKLVLVLTGGSIKWDADARDFDWSVTDALPRSVSGAFEGEPLFIDFRASKKENLSTQHPEFLDRLATLAATLRGMEKDEIAGEHVRQHRNTRRTALAAIGALCTLTVAATIFGIVSRRRGERIRKSFVDGQLSLGTALIREGRMAEGLWRYWSAYESTAPGDPARRSALNLIGSWSQLAGTPLVHDRGVREVMFGRNGTTVLTLTDRAARLWDLKTGEPIGEPVAASGTRWQASAVSRDAVTLVVASDTSADLWEIDTGKQRGPSLVHGDTISSVAISADGSTILTQGPRYLRFWDARTGKAHGPDVPADSASRAILAPDGQSVLVGFRGLRLIRVPSGESIQVPLRPDDQDNHMAAFDPRGTLIVAAGHTYEELRDYEFAEVWRVGSSAMMDGTISHLGRFTTIQFRSDGKRFLTGGDDNTAQVWELSGDKVTGVGAPLHHGGSVVAAAFGHGRVGVDDTIVTGSTDKMARLWKIRDLSMIQVASYPLRHDGSVDCVALSADGRTVLTGSSDGIARIWSPYVRFRARESGDGDAEKGAAGATGPHQKDLQAIFDREPSAVIAAISPDRKLVAIRGEDDTVGLRQASTGDPVGVPLRHRGPVLAVAFSPDGRLVATGSADNTAAIWDARSGALVGTPLTHEDAVNAVDFSPDGTTLLTGSGDTKARWWDVASGAMRGDPVLHSYKVQHARWVADGRGVVTRASGAAWSDDGSWNAPPAAADDAECLKLSLEWRTGYRLDSAQRLVRLTQSEWLAGKRRLERLGGACDVVGDP
jgi:WD40 repeat protein